jgi:hypothetical protein
MSTTLDELAACYDRAQLHYARHDQQGAIESSHSGYNGSYRVIAKLEQGGDMLTIGVPRLDVVIERNRLPCLEALLTLNYMLLVGRYACDLRDGEVLFRAAIPLENGTLTQAQFEHALYAVLASVDTYATVLKEITWGNVSPKEAIVHAEQAREARRSSNATTV